MNARQKAKKYKKELDFFKRKTVQPKIIKTEHDVVHLRTYQIVNTEHITNNYDYVNQIVARDFINQILNYADIRTEPAIDGINTVIQADMWVVNKHKY